MKVAGYTRRCIFEALCVKTRQEQREPKWTYLPGGGLPSEELVVEGAVRGVESGLQVDAAIGYGLQRGGAFIGEAKPNEELYGGRVRVRMKKKKTNQTPHSEKVLASTPRVCPPWPS